MIWALRFRWQLALAALAAFAAALTGCGTAGAPAGSQPGVAFQGRVHGGQQAVSGAGIMLYAAGASGNGTGAVSLLTPNVVETDAYGGFDITGDYTCPTPTTQVYLVARGGNPGLAPGTSNLALVLMSALGDCGNLSSSSFIFVNEVTTVASAWALSQFLAPGAGVGASATNATGLRNAFAVAGNLVDASTGLAPGLGLPAGSITETAKLYTLANSLAACVNSDGGAACGPLFNAATVAGAAPANTLDAALNIVRNPGANVAAVFQAGAAQAPFQPALPGQPSDWTLTITYGHCASGCGGLNLPGAVAIDSTGSAWVPNGLSAVVSKFSPTGLPVAAAGFAGIGLRASHGVTVDAQDNVWVSNEQSVTGANNSHLGSVSKFSSAGVELSGYGYTSGVVYYPQALAADATGVIWAADYGNSSATLLAASGTAISTNGYAASALPFTQSVAIDALHNAWFGIQQGVSRVTPTGVTTRFPCCDYPTGVALDAGGNVWLADYGAAAVTELNAAGTLLHSTTLNGGALSPQLLAIDGAGTVWSANFRGDSISELSGTDASLLSPAIGFGTDAPLDEPYGIAVDASGNLWVTNVDSNTLTQFVGLAAPVRTPLLGPPSQP